MLGSYLTGAIAAGSVKTLQELAVENAVRPGAQFIYNGHLYGKGFGYGNKTPALYRRPYTARHSSVSWSLMIGKNPLWVSKQHGHSPITMLGPTPRGPMVR